MNLLNTKHAFNANFNFINFYINISVRYSIYSYFFYYIALVNLPGLSGLEELGEGL